MTALRASSLEVNIFYSPFFCWHEKMATSDCIPQWELRLMDFRKLLVSEVSLDWCLMYTLMLMCQYRCVKKQAVKKTMLLALLIWMKAKICSSGPYLMMMQEKLLVNNRQHYSWQITFLQMWKVLILRTLWRLYCFVQKICFKGSFKGNYFFPFSSS